MQKKANKGFQKTEKLYKNEIQKYTLAPLIWVSREFATWVCDYSPHTRELRSKNKNEEL